MYNIQWDNVSRGYHGEWSPSGSPMAKTKGAAGPEGFGRGTSRGTPFSMIPPKLFHTFSFFCHPALVKRDFFQPMDALGSIMVNIQGMDFPKIPKKYHQVFFQLSTFLE